MSKKYEKSKDVGLTMYAHNHKSIEVLLRKFKKRVQQSGVLDEYKERQYYTKPSVKKRIKKKAAAYNARKTTS